jgi:hypothetical protein
VALLVLDEQLANPRLVSALEDRGIETKSVGDFGVANHPDPDVVRRIDARHPGAWVLVTMDLTVVEDYPGFDWNRYAIAWVVVHKSLSGSRVEQAKHEIVHRHAHRMREQARGDHHTYTAEKHFTTMPSLNRLLRGSR